MKIRILSRPHRRDHVFIECQPGGYQRSTHRGWWWGRIVAIAMRAAGHDVRFSDKVGRR